MSPYIFYRRRDTRKSLTRLYKYFILVVCHFKRMSIKSPLNENAICKKGNETESHKKPNAFPSKIYAKISACSSQNKTNAHKTCPYSKTLYYNFAINIITIYRNGWFHSSWISCERPKIPHSSMTTFLLNTKKYSIYMPNHFLTAILFSVEHADHYLKRERPNRAAGYFYVVDLKHTHTLAHLCAPYPIFKKAKKKKTHGGE